MFQKIYDSITSIKKDMNETLDFIREKIKKNIENKYDCKLKNKNMKYKKLFLETKLKQLMKEFNLNISVLIISSVSILISTISLIFVFFQIPMSQINSITSPIINARIQEIGINETLKEIGITYDQYINMLKPGLFAETFMGIWAFTYQIAFVAIFLSFTVPLLINYYNSIEIEIVIEKLARLD